MLCPTHSRYQGKRKPRTDCPNCWTIYENRELQDKVDLLKIQLDEIKQQKSISVHPYTKKKIKFGVVSDTHFGSLYERLDIIKLAYKIFKREKIKNVYHAGDILDGEKMYRSHEYEIAVHGADAQIEYCVENYPQVKGITTYFICGNHDLAYWRNQGNDIGEKIAQKRDDFIYLGREEADIELKSDSGKCKLSLIHPGKGTAYAISYNPQQYINSLTGGAKPNIAIMGHFHKSEYLFYRNVHLFQTGCLQSQTPFMRRKQNPAMVGFWIIEIVLSKKGIERCRSEFFPSYL